MTDDLGIPGFLDRRAAPGPHDIAQQCSKCGDAAEFGYNIEGAMQWFCDKHKISQNYADARLPKVNVSESRQATELANHAKAIRGIWTCASGHLIRHVILIGEHLVKARAICPHGEWLPWLEREFEWSQSTADRFMQVYRKKDELPHAVGNFDFPLPLNGQYLLAAPSTPPEVRQDIKERVESGERLSVTQIRETIAEAREPPSESRTTGGTNVPGAKRTTPDPPPNHKQIAAGLTLARQMSLATLDQFILGLRQIRREKKRA